MFLLALEGAHFLIVFLYFLIVAYILVEKIPMISMRMYLQKKVRFAVKYMTANAGMAGRTLRQRFPIKLD